MQTLSNPGLSSWVLFGIFQIFNKLFYSNGQISIFEVFEFLKIFGLLITQWAPEIF